MTLDEAKKIVAISGLADDGCEDCVNRLLEELEVAFPEFEWYRDDSRYQAWLDGKSSEEEGGQRVFVRLKGEQP